MSEATQKGQTLCYTDTNQDLPTCALIYAAVSEAARKLAVNSKEEAWGHHLTPIFVLQAGIYQTMTVLLKHTSGALCWGTQATTQGFTLPLGSCTLKSNTITNLLHFSKCPWRGTITQSYTSLLPQTRFLERMLWGGCVFNTSEARGTLPVGWALTQPESATRFIDSRPPKPITFKRH